MRPSNRAAAIEAALRIIGTHGVSGLTFEAVAKETGITKGGLLYHFATKEEMIEAITENLWRVWDEEALDQLGKEFDEATVVERLIAQIKTTVGDTVDITELAIFVDLMRLRHYQESYQRVMGRWYGSGSDPLSIDQRIAHLAAEGLWLGESTDTVRLEPGERARLIERLIELAGHEDGDAAGDGATGFDEAQDTAPGAPAA